MKLPANLRWAGALTGVLLVFLGIVWMTRAPMDVTVRPYLMNQHPQVGDVVVVTLGSRQRSQSSIETVAVAPGGTFQHANGARLSLPPHYYAMLTSDGRPRIVPEKYISGRVQIRK